MNEQELAYFFENAPYRVAYAFALLTTAWGAPCSPAVHKSPAFIHWIYTNGKYVLNRKGNEHYDWMVKFRSSIGMDVR